MSDSSGEVCLTCAMVGCDRLVKDEGQYCYECEVCMAEERYNAWFDERDK